mgnify:CR=1 FL=1
MIIKNAALETVCGITSKLPDNSYPEVCFAGKSNVGKSSLINALMNRKSLARTSAQPGKTQTINFYNINQELYFVDLPGYGYAKISFKEKERFAELMEGYFTSGRNIGHCFVLIDMRREAGEQDIQMLDLLKNSGIPATAVLTKCDKLNKTEFEKQLSLLKKQIGAYADEKSIIPFSSLKGTGVESIREILEKNY